MVLLNFSFTGENSTGTATFTIAQEYKFKNLYLEDVKYTILNQQLENSVSSGTANAGIASVNTTISSPLAIKVIP